MLLFDSGARRELLILAGVLVPFESAEQPPVVFDVGVDAAGQPDRVNFLGVRLVEVLVAWVVDQSRV